MGGQGERQKSSDYGQGLATQLGCRAQRTPVEALEEHPDSGWLATWPGGALGPDTEQAPVRRASRGLCCFPQLAKVFERGRHQPEPFARQEFN